MGSYEQPLKHNKATRRLTYSILLSFQLKLYGNLTTQTAIIISHKVWNMFSWKEFYQKDVALVYEVILALLDFESNQVEDKLASSQDKKFLDVSCFWC